MRMAIMDPMEERTKKMAAAEPLETPRRTLSCGQCGAEGPTKWCGSCKVQSYCSVECQRTHWKVHRSACKRMGARESKRYVVGVRLFGPELPVLARRQGCRYGARVGIRNEGNTCYLSSVVQALTYSPLADYLVELDPIGNTPTKAGFNLMSELSVHVRRVWAANEALAARDVTNGAHGALASARASTSEMSIAGTLLRCSRHAGRMEDAHECLTDMLARLLEACAVGYDGTQDEAWEKSTVVYEVFGMELAQAVVCGGCGHTSKTSVLELALRLNATLGLSEADMFRATSVDRALERRLLAKRRAPIDDDTEDDDLYDDHDEKYAGPPATTIDDLLSLFFASENIEDFACEKCQTRCTCEKRAGFASPPRSISLYVDRVPAFGALFGKLNRVVAFRQQLDLAPYLPDADGHTTYRLYAVVTHLDYSGSTFFGHYICHVRDAVGDWWLLDDETVKPVTWHQVKQSNPYLLFYARSDIQGDDVPDDDASVAHEPRLDDHAQTKDEDDRATVAEHFLDRAADSPDDDDDCADLYAFD